MAESKLTINLQGRDQSASSALRQLASQIDAADRGIKGMISSIGAVTQPLGSMMYVAQQVKGAIADLARSAKELIDIYAVQERAEISLAHTLQTTKNAVGMSAKELMNMASAFQSVTIYGDEAIMSMQQLFVATKAIGADIMPRAVESALDMATVLGTDCTSAAKMLAKVLADPKANLDALKEANIQLTQAEKEHITALQEANALNEAQSFVLSKIESSYGGIAKEIGSLDTSKLTQISNVVGDIKEGLGESLVNALSPALDWILSTLERISGWVNEHADTQVARSTARDLLASPVPNTLKVSSFSDEVLRAIIDESSYDSLTTEYMRSGHTASQAANWYNTTASDIYGHAKNAGLLVAAARLELDKRYSLPTFNGGSASTDSSSSSQTQVVNTLESFLNANSAMSVTAQSEQIFSKMLEAYGWLGGASPSEQIILNEIIAGMTNKLMTINGLSDASGSTTPVSALETFLGANAGLSQTAQRDSIYAQMLEAQTLLNGATEEERVILNEIINSLTTQLFLIEGIEDSSGSTAEIVNDQAEALQELMSQMSLWGGEFINLSSSITDLITGIIDRQMAETESMLDSTMDKWDKYFSELDEKQGREADSLAMMFDKGLISLEEYKEGLQNLSDIREADAIKAEQEEEALHQKKNELGESAFKAQQANAIAAATINAAQAITKIWAEHAANPTVAGILTGLSIASTGAELATISSQRYTPMASGGIVTAPTRALIGEGGAKEAIIPLTPDNLERHGLGRSEGVININISVGTSYNGDQLADDIFHAIERSQRTGALPNWRTA